LNRDVRLTKYSRPVEGDYNGDGWIDLALQTSDGYWRIAWGNKDFNYNRNFDINTKYLTDAQLAEAPGWAYLAVVGSREPTFKIPDGVSGAGEWWGLTLFPSGWQASKYDNLNFGGNEWIPMMGNDVGTKSKDGIWKELNSNLWILIDLPPSGIFGGLECHPFSADYDGDGKSDRAVQCPSEFRIVQTSDNSVRHISLPYDPSEFSMPGKIYTGGISYQTSRQLIDYQLSISNDPPVIPVDMIQGDFCSIPWEPSKIPQECR
ncbi:MAG: hypothetical protein HY877_06655, partial [Deltaproteobacteria bacterium]|nr:hypothetical protein [Deltaproteobacteria bacterium]